MDTQSRWMIRLDQTYYYPYYRGYNADGLRRV
jgi:hypothetical protein